MALGAEEFSELVTATLENRDKEKVHDQVFKRQPTLDLLRQNEKSANGRQHVVNLELGENTSTQLTDRSGSFSTAKSADILGTAVYQWSKPIVSSVRLIWQDLQENMGKAQVVNLVKAHIRNMEKSHAKKLVTMLHTAAASVEAGSFLSLDEVVSDAAYDASDLTRTVGGIDSASQALWVATRRTAADADLTVRQAIRRTANDITVVTHTNSNPDHMITGRTVFEEFEDSFDDKVRYVEFGEGQTKFRAIQFGDLQVRLDPDCDAEQAYLLDISSWDVKSLAGNFMSAQPSQEIQGTLDRVTPVATVLSVGVNERRANAKLIRTYA